MPSQTSPDILIIGMSHVGGIKAAATADGLSHVQVANLARAPRLFDHPDGTRIRLKRLGRITPRTVVLCLLGNLHNTLSLIRHPLPFALGAPGGTAPNSPDLDMIPTGVIRATMQQLELNRTEALTAQIHAHWPTARFLHMSPPPPLGDEDHIRANPRTMADMLPQGIGHPALRRRMFDIQADMLQEIAIRHNATWLPAPSWARDAKGLLKKEFSANDPTHANSVYARIVLRQIDAALTAPQPQDVR